MSRSNNHNQKWVYIKKLQTAQCRLVNLSQLSSSIILSLEHAAGPKKQQLPQLTQKSPISFSDLWCRTSSTDINFFVFSS